MKLLLKKYFGYENFKPMQLEVINNVLQKKDSLVLMPTGGGKSICYQIPALELKGLTIVISPLISLMKDQVDNLKANGIKAEYINSSLSLGEIEEIKERIIEKDLKILYIAPERLASEDFKIFLINAGVSLIAIDEAHCISEWGHNFRSEYRNLKFLKVFFPDVPIIALTATATLKVREDILKQLSLKNPEVFTASFNRENLNLVVMRKKDSFYKILNLIKKYKDESVIIYCFSRKDSEGIAKRLRENGFDALPYHAGLSNKIRKENQNLFIKDKLNIIVATIAFGMGIDKPDVRLIIHHTFSKSLEGYYQEIGRAGRDGLPSDCVLLYSRGDKRKHDFFIDQIEDEVIKRNAQDKLNKMMFYCENKSCRRKNMLRYFGEGFLEDNCKGCDVCLNIPEMEIKNVKKFNSKSMKKDMPYDKLLFEKLRALRKVIADERNVPQFVIFGNLSLREMAFYVPKNGGEFLKINGVGQQKLKDFGKLFLDVIGNHEAGNDVSLKKGFLRDDDNRNKHRGNLQKTKQMVLGKISLEDIANMQGFISQIGKIVDSGEKIDIDYLAPPEGKFRSIEIAFEKFGFGKISPIYNYFNGDFSYDEIRLVGLILKSRR